MKENNRIVTRRKVLRGSVIAAGIGVGGGALFYRSEPVVAIEGEELAFDDISANVADRSVETVEIDFEDIEVFYEGFDPDPNNADVIVEVAVGDAVEDGEGDEEGEVINVQSDPANTEGDGEFTLIDLLEEEGEGEEATADILGDIDNIPNDSFDIPEDESSSTTDVEIAVDSTLTNENSDEASRIASETAEITVTLDENVEVGGDIGDDEVTVE